MECCCRHDLVQKASEQLTDWNITQFLRGATEAHEYLLQKRGENWLVEVWRDDSKSYFSNEPFLQGYGSPWQAASLLMTSLGLPSIWGSSQHAVVQSQQGKM